MINDLSKDVKARMGKAVESLQSELMTMRTGRASPALVERVRVDYYGVPTPLNQLATISVPEPRLLTIKPWDASVLSNVEKALMKSDLGLTPSSDGHIIRLSIPRLTEERRLELVKQVNRRVEEGKIALRNIRREGVDDLREMEKEKMISEDEMFGGRDDLQEITDGFAKRMDEIGKAKEEEVMEV
ncbi:MAG: ribosome recycling factor [Thermoplasmata archaeon]|nr:ribosome recycling factor [Thermoplasmata archaeon]